jgi:Domain of unknown function (DUF202)
LSVWWPLSSPPSEPAEPVTPAGAPVDRGLARERTVLAWSRSGLAAVVCVAVLLRHVWPLHGNSRYLALGLVAAGAIAWAGAFLVFVVSGGGGEVRPPSGEDVFRLITIATLILAALGFVLAFVAPP